MDSSQTVRRSSSEISQKRHQHIEMFHNHHHHDHHQLQAMKSSRRGQSFSSSSSSLSSYNPNGDSAQSTPSSTPLRFSGKPFSWEYFPGIPKKQLSQKSPPSTTSKLLPLPPPTIIGAVRVSKKNRNPSGEFFDSDPFFAAMIECSKGKVESDDELSLSSGGSVKVSRSFGDKLGLVNLYASCKRTCSVTESIHSIPRSTRRSYGLINTRSAR